MKQLGMGIFYLYIFGVVIATPYCNWVFAHNHGFVKWIFFGEIIATLQAFIWPIWLFTGNFG